MADEKILDRVRGLLAKAESTEFPEEAEALTAKAMELMAKHQLDEALLGDRKVTTNDVNSRTIRVHAPYAKEKYLLLNAIASALDARAVAIVDTVVRIDRSTGTRRTSRSYGKGVDVKLYGFAEDLDWIELLYTSLLIQIPTALKKARARIGEDLATFRSSWMLGFNNAIYQRLMVIRQRATNAAEAESVSTTGRGAELVLADRKAIVERVYAEANPDVRTFSTKSTGSGFGAGHRAGMEADINQTRIGQKRTALNR